MYEIIKNKFLEIIEGMDLESEEVRIFAKPLTPEEAIGNPEDQDYPIQKGKERLLQAEFRGSHGQAFTDMFGNYEGKLSQVVRMNLTNNFRRAIFIATINAVMRYLGRVSKTIHCKDKDPKECGQELVKYINKSYGNPKVMLVGLQPRMLEAMKKEFELKVTDMDKDNIGQEKYGIRIDPPEKTKENLKWCDIALVTGTTVINNTISEYNNMAKPTIFYGVTVSGVAHLLGLDHFCPISR